MAMYTNQTAEELETWRCTSDGIFKSQNSIWMKINFVFVFILIFLTFYLSFKAARVLKNHNVYSKGSQILLMITLLNANLNQLIFLEIRIRHLVHIFINSEDPCKIEFHSPECTYDQTIYAFTSVMSTGLLSALTFDRFFALYASTVYVRNSKDSAYMLITVSIIVTVIVHIRTYGGVSRAGYVPSCTYPPQLSLNTYQVVNNAIFWIIMANCVLTIAVLLLNIYKDKRIKKSVFDTKTRYNSFENVLTTKAICSVTSTQFVFLSFSTAALAIIRTLEAGMSEEVFHINIQYINGGVYGNLSIPVLIYLKTNQCILQRRKSIDKMTNHTGTVDSHISSLKTAWET
ncbi:Serpentine receptor class alpha-27 [Caenorhabditis elegans]|uniref:Serpentine receptor class alpha-27 n=1 Tax=Caenorhabditis elegans TaxID=6239 RepID=SRA27_CAEEL|nr:Serpentine receptor class alpha-27 [Caenorhabditis elegans]Q19549.2 RecName: Full=Serpentine receptor class alpha-27; Short=Protein sra-27 [Caenorhabditis elegans]CCD68192.1 Serpentine receptor class alpha-27 [Caenorhabditis elegans]|eukprot:NP_495328.2 Serpentine receptor class alpha-27 [Caenorhabditis elegans]